MRVKNVKISGVKGHIRKGYCPNCEALIIQKRNNDDYYDESMNTCCHCKQVIEWTKTQELAEEIRREISQPQTNINKINKLLDDIILETTNIESK